jgi:transcriptional regulator with XRE-family HTH domain
MKKTDNKMLKNDDLTGKKVGFRFMLFRKAIGKTVRELSSELNVPESTITGIENGDAYPEIEYLHCLHEKYGLNINWLLTKTGRMFVKKSPSETKDPMVEKYAELIELMRVPAVEQAIEAALTEIRALLELEKEKNRE